MEDASTLSCTLVGLLTGIIQGFLAMPTLSYSPVLAKKVIRKTNTKKPLFLANILTVIFAILLNLGHLVIARVIQESLVLPLVFGKRWVLGVCIGIQLYIIYNIVIEFRKKRTTKKNVIKRN